MQLCLVGRNISSLKFPLPLSVVISYYFLSKREMTLWGALSLIKKNREILSSTGRTK